MKILIRTLKKSAKLTSLYFETQFLFLVGKVTWGGTEDSNAHRTDDGSHGSYI